MKNYYILFANYTEGLLLHDLLKANGLKARISPTPRTIQGSVPCGMSLLVNEEDELLLKGLEIDYVQDEFGSEFTLHNPNMIEIYDDEEGGCCGSGCCC